MITHTLAIWLVLSPPEVVPAIDATEFTSKIEAVLTTPDAVTITELEQAIAGMEAQPLVVVTDPILADDLLRARVVLAWAYDDPQQARAAMDEVVRSAGGRAMPLSGLGTDLKTLAKERLDALAVGGTANIEVDCAVPCQLIVNERNSANLTDPLPLGTYRVWVVATAGNVAPLREHVVLDRAGQTKHVVFGATSPEDPFEMVDSAIIETPPPLIQDPEQPTGTPLIQDPEQPTGPPLIQAPERQPADEIREPDLRFEPRPAKARAMLPLWSEVLGVVAGVGLLATGSALLALDGKCRNGREVRSCPQLLENTPQGIALVSAGAGVLSTFGALLTVDRVRMGEREGLAATAAWTFRF